jgi:hypothetical protein
MPILKGKVLYNRINAKAPEFIDLYASKKAAGMSAEEIGNDPEMHAKAEEYGLIGEIILIGMIASALVSIYEFVKLVKDNI